MTTTRPQSLFDALHGQLVVSVQADPTSPLRDTQVITAMSRAALVGGAGGLRLRGGPDIAAVRPLTQRPIIGLTKNDHPGTEVYITATPAEVAEVALAGADLVAFDATQRPRPHSARELIEAVHAHGKLAMADVSTLQEAEAALADGADLVSTTMSGYTAHSPQSDEPDWALMAALTAAGLPFAAEGRLRTPEHARRALDLGAHCVVVGSAITRPDDVTRWFVQALQPPVAQP